MMESLKRKIEIAINTLNIKGKRLFNENASDLERSIVIDDLKELLNLSKEFDEIVQKIETKTEEIKKTHKLKNDLIIKK